MSEDLPVLKKGSFYLIKDENDFLVLEDKTKRGLTVREKSFDPEKKVEAEKGVIHDSDGIGHHIPIRWFFPKDKVSLTEVLSHAEKMEKKYTELRELTCPDD